MKQIKCWIEAMRLRTLPVSIAGVILAIGYAISNDNYDLTPAWLCLAFAILAQIASNFANEYYDYKGGLDRKGREGPRRGVTEGDISPSAMKYATFGTLALACIIGCCLIPYGGWWLIAIGLFIALGVIAYSAGPYPLSHHGLGEVAVLFFFGVIPVNLTYFLMTQQWNTDVVLGSISAGLIGANVLIVNNYRDYEDDKAVNKRTLAVKFGQGFASTLYFINGSVSIVLMANAWADGPIWRITFPATYALIHLLLYLKITQRKGRELNPFLGMTAIAMLYYCASFTITAILD